MIVLLSYSTSWCQNENTTISSTGEQTVTFDSVLIAYNDLRKVNAKLIELKYEKEINDSLRSIITNDEIIMREYKYNVNTLQKQIAKAKKERNIGIGGGIIAALSLVITLIVK